MSLKEKLKILQNLKERVKVLESRQKEVVQMLKNVDAFVGSLVDMKKWDSRAYELGTYLLEPEAS